MRTTLDADGLNPYQEITNDVTSTLNDDCDLPEEVIEMINVYASPLQTAWEELFEKLEEKPCSWRSNFSEDQLGDFEKFKSHFLQALTNIENSDTPKEREENISALRALVENRENGTEKLRFCFKDLTQLVSYGRGDNFKKLIKATYQLANYKSQVITIHNFLDLAYWSHYRYLLINKNSMPRVNSSLLSNSRQLQFIGARIQEVIDLSKKISAANWKGDDEDRFFFTYSSKGQPQSFVFKKYATEEGEKKFNEATLLIPEEDKAASSAIQALQEIKHFKTRGPNCIYRTAREIHAIIPDSFLEEKNYKIDSYILLIQELCNESDFINIRPKGAAGIEGAFYGDPIKLLEDLINNKTIFDTEGSKEDFLKDLKNYLRETGYSSSKIDKIIELTLEMSKTHNIYKLSSEYKSLINNVNFIESLKNRFGQSIDFTKEQDGQIIVYVNKENSKLNTYFENLLTGNTCLLFLSDEPIHKMMGTQDAITWFKNLPETGEFKKPLAKKVDNQSLNTDAKHAEETKPDVNVNGIQVYAHSPNSFLSWGKGYWIEADSKLQLRETLEEKGIYKSAQSSSKQSVQLPPEPTGILSVKGIEDFLKKKSIKLPGDPDKISLTIVHKVVDYLEKCDLKALTLPKIFRPYMEGEESKQMTNLEFITKHLLSLIQYKQVLDKRVQGVFISNKDKGTLRAKKGAIEELVNQLLEAMHDGKSNHDIVECISGALNKENVTNCTWSSTTEERMVALAKFFDEKYEHKMNGYKYNNPMKWF